MLIHILILILVHRSIDRWIDRSMDRSIDRALLDQGVSNSQDIPSTTQTYSCEGSLCCLWGLQEEPTETWLQYSARPAGNGQRFWPGSAGFPFAFVLGGGVDPALRGSYQLCLEQSTPALVYRLPLVRRFRRSIIYIYECVLGDLQELNLASEGISFPALSL